MTDYKEYINALIKCAEEHKKDRTDTGNIIVSDLCRDTANLLENELERLRAENEDIKRKIVELRLALEHNEKVNKDKELRLQWEADMRFRDGYIEALEYALVCVTRGVPINRKDYDSE